MEFERIFSTLKSFKFWLLGSCLLAACLALAWHFVASPKYVAKALVIVDTTGPGQPNGSQGTAFSQIEVATSERVLVQAASSLPAQVRDRVAATGSAAPGDLADRVRSMVAVTVGRDSTVMQIAATARDGETASAIANAVANAYLQVSTSIRTEPARQRAQFYRARTSELQDEAVKAQAQLVAFQQENHLVPSTAERGDVDQALLGELVRRTTDLRAQYLGSAAGRGATQSSPGASPEVLGNTVVQSLQLDVARARTRLQDMSARLGENHPQYLAAAGELAELERNLKQQTALAASSVSAAGRADSRSADKLSEAVDKQKSVIVDLAGKREQLAVLQQRADYARKSFESMRDRLSEATIEGGSNLGSASLLAVAEPPRKATVAPLTRTVPVAAAAGFLLAAFAAIAIEVKRPRLRAASDLVHLGLGQIAVIPTAVAKSVKNIEPLAIPASSVLTPNDRRLGALLVAAGRLKASDEQAIFQEHARWNEPYGAVAVRMGLVSEEDVEKALSTQYGIRRITNESVGNHSAEQFVADQHPSHPVAEAIRVLRSYVMLEAESSGRIKTLAVTSPDRGDGKSFIAANLAIAFSQVGMKVLLVEADMRNPQMAIRFGSQRRTGLSSYLAGFTATAPILPLSEDGSLSLLPAGPVPPNPQELLCHPRFSHLMKDLPQRFDMILIDSPANSVGSDAQIIAARAKSAVIVGHWNQTSLGSLQMLKRRLAEASVEVVGVIVNHGKRSS